MEKKERGFTLIEISIATAIISLVVALAVARLNTSKSDAQEKKRSALISSIESAKNRYMLKSEGDILGQNTSLDDIAPLLTTRGESIEDIFNLVEGTGKNPTDLDLGSYGVRPANFDGLGGGNTTSSLNPYGSLNEFLEAAGLNPDFSGTPDWSNVLNTPGGTSALEEYIDQLPPNLYESIALTENLDPNAANVLLLNMQEGPEANLASRGVFFKSLDPNDPLYAQRGSLDYSNQSWKWPPSIPYAGIDLSGSGITGANLVPEDYDPNNPSIWQNWGGMNFTGANLSGIDMSGFQWGSGTGSTLSIPIHPVFLPEENITNVNFTGAQNIDLTKLIGADGKGMIFTSTGITKQAYEQALLNAWGSQLQVSNQLQTQQGQAPYWTESRIQEWLDARTSGITFDVP